MTSALIAAGLVCLAAMLFWPETPAGAVLRRELVERPARWIAKTGWRRIARLALLLPLAVVLIAVMPELAAVAALVGDVTIVAEITLALAAASAAGAFASLRRAIDRIRRAAGGLIRLALGARRFGREPRRPRRGGPGGRSRNGEDPEPGWAPAYA